MTDIVLVAMISAGVALATALLTQLLTARAASKSADRQDRREALQWQRNEAIRLQDLERKEALRREELQEQRVRELWGHVLTTRWQMVDLLEAVAQKQTRSVSKSAPVSTQSTPLHAAGQAYLVALTGITALRPTAKAFYGATSQVQIALLESNEAGTNEAVKDWNDAYKALEKSVAMLVDGPAFEDVQDQVKLSANQA